MVSWLVCLIIDSAVRVQALSRDNVLCFRARHLTLTVPLSTWLSVISKKGTGCHQFSSYWKDVPLIIQNMFWLWSTNLSITRSKNHTKLSRGFWYGGPVPEKSGCCAVYLKNTKFAVMRFCRQRNLWNSVMSQLIDLLSTNKIYNQWGCFKHMFSVITCRVLCLPSCKHEAWLSLIFKVLQKLGIEFCFKSLLKMVIG